MQPRVLAVILSVALLSSPMPRAGDAVAPPAASAAPSGALEAAVEVDRQGAAVYRIPLQTPPGTGGIEPDLALVYNSQIANGTIGVGFTLTGLPTIARVGATIAQDGFRGGVHYDTRDRFALDGNRLIEVGGGRNARFHTERESWSAIEPSGQCGTGPCTFTARERTGNRVEFGGTPDSRILQEGGAEVRVWAVSRIEDPHGNFLTVEYAPRGGELYPSRILYTGNAKAPVLPAQRVVVFTYEPREDVAVHYLGGAAIRTDQRLRAIASCVSSAAISDCRGASLAAEYVLAYEQAPVTRRSRVVSITACGGDGADRVCHAPTRFTWQNETPGFAPTAPDLPGPLFTATQDGRRSFINGILEDLTGDGIPDYTRATKFLANTPDLRVWKGQTDGTFVDAGFALPGPIFHSTSTVTHRVAVLQDFNGDGLPDYSAASRSPGGSDLAVWLGTGSGFVRQDNYKLPDALFSIAGSANYQIGILQDLDGDGLPEYAHATRQAGGDRLDIWRGTGTAFVQTGKNLPGPLFQIRSDRGSERMAVLQDLDGDGLPDYCAARQAREGEILDPQVYLAVAPGFDYRATFALPGPLFWYVRESWASTGILADVNGDAIADYSRATLIEGDVPRELYDVHLGTGVGYAAAGFRLPGPINVFNSSGWRREGEIVDRDGDGAADYTRGVENVSDPSRNDFRLFRATANGFVEAGLSLPGPLFRVVGPAVSLIEGEYVDVDGNNLADYVKATCVFAPDGSLVDCRKQLRLAAGSAPDLLVRVSDGLGRITSLTYAPLTDSRLYRRAESTPAGMSVQWPMYVVSSRVDETAPQLSDAGYARYAYTYRYAAGRISRTGRGFLGFGIVQIDDPQRRITTITEYAQEFPFDGTVTRQTIKRLSDGAALGGTEAKHSSSSPFPGVHLVQLDEQRITRRTADGKAYVTSSAHWYDRWGNLVLTRERQNADSAWNELYVCRRYFSSESPWRIGILTDSIRARAATFDPAAGTCSTTGVLAHERNVIDPATTDIVREENLADVDAGRWLVTSYTYDPWGNAASRTDPNGAVTRFEVDPIHRTFPRTTTTPIGATSQLFEPRYGTLVSETDLNDHTTTQQVDGLGRFVSRSGPAPDGTPVVLERKTYGLDGGRPFEEASERLDWAGTRWRTTRTYLDGLDRAYRVRTDGPEGKVILTESKWDTETRLTWESLPHFESESAVGTATVYDDYGRAAVITLPNGARTTLDYAIETLNGVAFLRVTRTDASSTPEARSTASYLDDEGRVVRRVYARDAGDAAPAIVDTMIDPLGRAERTSGPAGTTQTLFDAINRVKEETSSPRGRTVFAYDDRGLLTRRTDARGAWIAYEYDALGRVRNETTSDSEVVTYTYDDRARRNGIGQLTAVEAKRYGATAYRYEHAYDDYGQLQQVIRTIAGRSYTFRSDRDAAGRVERFVFPDGTISRNVYTPDDRLERVDLCSEPGCARWDNYVQYGRFTPLGQPRRLAFPNGVVSTFDYTSAGALQTAKTAGRNGPLLEYRYERDRNDNVQAIQDVLQPSRSEKFAYSSQGYLERATGRYGALRFTYDLGGNRKSHVDAEGVTTLYSYDTNGRLTTAERAGARIYDAVYDAAGNVVRRTTNGKTLAFAFDARGQLTDVCRDACDGAANRIVSFTYDVLGRRLTKRDAEGATTEYVDESYEVVRFANGKAQQTKYVSGAAARLAAITTAITAADVAAATVDVHRFRASMADTSRIAGRIDAAASMMAAWLARVGPSAMFGAGLTLFAFLAAFAIFAAITVRPRTRWALAHAALLRAWPLAIAAILSAPSLAIAEPALPSLASAEGYPVVGETLFFTTNQTDSVSLVTVPNGDVTARVDYKPFGELFENTSLGTDSFRGKFLSSELDRESGLYALGARYYDPAVGRFLSGDENEIGGPDDAAAALNRYVYSLNNPVNLIDPSGAEAVSIGTVAAIIASIVIGAIVGAYAGASIANESLNPFEWDWGSSRTYVGIAVGAAVGAVGGALSAGISSIGGGGVAAVVVGGAAAGAFENAAFALMRGDPPEEILLSAAQGAVLGAVLTGVAALGSRVLSRGHASARTAASAGKVSAIEGRIARFATTECQCFTGGTVVAAHDGAVAIEDVLPNDSVWSYADERGTELNRVNQLFTRVANEIVRVVVGETVIEATPEHPFWVEAKGWTRAVDLEKGDELRTAAGELVPIDALEYANGTFRVHNFEVDRNHNYFVSEKQILVHNVACSKTFARASFRKSTVKDNWKTAPTGINKSTRKCPTCGKSVGTTKTKKVGGKRQYVWESDHTGATWAQRKAYMQSREKATGVKYTRKEVLDEYNRNTRLQCSSCNRSHRFEPTATQAKAYLQTIPDP